VAQGRGRRSGSRRVRVPGIAELLRPASQVSFTAAQRGAEHRQASGRENHSHKITVYLTDAELHDLEHARLTLRGFGIPADRGRIVREALAVLLADLDAEGAECLLARRLHEGH
jgi:hypothetical protein